jgi:MYXO-CTERM domain-containing protein
MKVVLSTLAALATSSAGVAYADGFWKCKGTVAPGGGAPLWIALAFVAIGAVLMWRRRRR